MSGISVEYDEDALLAALHAHGQQFLSTFGSLPLQPERKHRKLNNDSDEEESSFPESEGEEEEWNGFSVRENLSEDEDTVGQVSGEESKSSVNTTLLNDDLIFC